MGNKNRIIIIIAIVVIAGGALLFLKGRTSPIDTSALGNDEEELTALGNDISSSADEAIYTEIDQTLKDITDVSGGVSTDGALDGASISGEINQADISESIADFGNEAAELKALEQAFDDVSQ